MIKIHQASCFTTLLLLLSGGVVHAATLTVKIAATHKSESLLNNKIAKPAQLRATHSYHVTIGVIEGVPKSQAKKLKKETYAFLRSVRNPKQHPIPFDVSRAASIPAIGQSVVLLPSNSSVFRRLNQRLSQFVQAGASQGLRLSAATRPQNYRPHMTLKTPKVGQNQQALNQQASSSINQYLQSHTVTVQLYEYRISISP